MLESDSKLKATIASLADRERLSTKTLLKEAFALSRKRPTPRLRSTNAHNMPDEILALSANRARLSQIKLEIMQEYLILASLEKDSRNYLRAKYSNWLNNANAKGQEAMLDVAILPIEKRVRTLKNALTLIDICIDDYNKAGMEFTATVHALNNAARA